MSREQTQTMDVFEQLRWLAKADANREEILEGVINGLKVFFREVIPHHSTLCCKACLLDSLTMIANNHGGEKRALELKQMMEDTMGL